MQGLDLRNILKMEKVVLSNGLKLVLVKKNIPTVSLALSYKVGSKNESHGTRGFAHLFEHMMFEGSKNVPHGKFDEYCSIAGGTNNAYTTYDWTSYTMTVPSHQLELALWLESDRLFNFEVSEDALETQKNVVTEEIRQVVENSPYGRWRELLSENAYPAESGYSWEVHGTIEDVQAADLQKANDFHSKYYRPDNAVLVLVGDVDNTSIELVKKYFDKPLPENLPNLDNTHSEKAIIGNKKAEYYDNVPHPAVFLNYHLDGFASDDVLKADLLANILGTGKSSRLFEGLVYEDQIASSVGAYVDKREISSLLTLYSIGSEKNIQADDLSSLMKDELKHLLLEGINEEELQKAKNQIISSIAYEIQYSYGIADVISSNVLFFEDDSKLLQILEKYNSINAKELIEFGEKLFDFENCVRIDVLPKF
jgi:zinc protease